MLKTSLTISMARKPHALAQPGPSASHGLFQDEIDRHLIHCWLLLFALVPDRLKLIIVH